MATNQENRGVALHFISFLMDDCAPDAEAPYYPSFSASFYGTFTDAQAFAESESCRLRVCGYEIRLNKWNSEPLCTVMGNFDNDY